LRDSGELRKKGTTQAQKTYARHRMPAKHTFGTRIADIKKHCEDDQRPAGTGVAVDVGDTDCTLPVASAYIEKMEAAGKMDMSSGVIGAIVSAVDGAGSVGNNASLMTSKHSDENLTGKDLADKKLAVLGAGKLGGICCAPI